RRELFAQGKRVLAAQLALTVVVPVAGSLVAVAYPALKPYVALVSLIIAVLDPTVVDRWHRRLLKKAAKLQEQFDTTVLMLPWDDFIAGEHVIREDIHGLSRHFDPHNQDPRLINWYPIAVGNVAIHFARIVCQRSNLWYDGMLRRRYANWVLGISIGLTVI